jgi:uncharacterized protein (DUF305 family)
MRADRFLSGYGHGNGRRAFAIVRATACRVGMLACYFAMILVSHGGDQWHQPRAQIRYEVRLLTELIEHHQFVSELASLAADRAVHTDLQELGTFLTWSLRSEIIELRNLLADTHDMTYLPRLSRQDERAIERLSRLEDESFEVALMNELIRAHSATLRSGRDCERRAGHNQIKAACMRISEEQAAQVAQLRGWLCQWYSRCGGVD